MLGLIRAEGLPYDGFEMCFGGQRQRIDLFGLSGKRVMDYGQTEVTHDLMDQRAAQAQPTVYEAQDVSVHHVDGKRPRVRYQKDGVAHELECDFIAGCDGIHGVCRASVPRSVIQTFEKVYAFGRLFLAGDAAHIVPPTGAKGLNQAASDVALLSRGLAEHYRGHDEDIDRYSQRALARVWKAERFSWWFTTLMHHFPENGEFGAKMQRAELDYLFSSRAAQTAVAENYVGLAL